MQAMKEYHTAEFKHALSIVRYKQDTQGNVVAGFLADLFNQDCKERGVVRMIMGLAFMVLIADHDACCSM